MERQRSILEQSVLATLSYYDVFSYPLSLEELWRWLYVVSPGDREELASVKPIDVERTTELLVQQGDIEKVGSFFVLAGRSMHLATRMQRKEVSRRMWRRARYAASILRVVPFIRFIGVVNTLAIDNARPESDIDFFIIARRGRLWTTRFFVTILTYVLGIRRHGPKIANRVCLSFFLADNALSLESMKIENDDPYLAFWTTTVVPLFSYGQTWELFLQANEWSRRLVPNGQMADRAAYHADAWVPGILRSMQEIILFGWLGNSMDWLLKRLQRVKMKFPSIQATDRGESGVVISDTMLKFHERDRRRQFRGAFYSRFGEVQR